MLLDDWLVVGVALVTFLPKTDPCGDGDRTDID